MFDCDYVIFNFVYYTKNQYIFSIKAGFVKLIFHEIFINLNVESSQVVESQFDEK